MPDQFCTTHLDELIVALRKLRNAGRTLVVGIEGHSTSGKTTLGKLLAIRFAAPHVGTDSYVDRDKDADSYVGILDLPRFKAAVQAELGKYDFLFIDGICLRDTLAQCGLRAGVFVYCRRITQAGLWADDPQNSTHQGRPNRDDPSWVDWQSTDYHLREHPVERADLVYDRHEDDADLTNE